MYSWFCFSIAIVWGPFNYFPPLLIGIFIGWWTEAWNMYLWWKWRSNWSKSPRHGSLLRGRGCERTGCGQRGWSREQNGRWKWEIGVGREVDVLEFKSCPRVLLTQKKRNRKLQIFKFLKSKNDVNICCCLCHFQSLCQANWFLAPATHFPSTLKSDMSRCKEANQSVPQKRSDYSFYHVQKGHVLYLHLVPTGAFSVGLHTNLE